MLASNIIKFPKANRNRKAMFVQPPALSWDDEFENKIIKPYLERFNEYNKVTIKSEKHIHIICKYFLDRNEYRNYMLFVLGINLGLRVSDLARLRFINLIDEDYSYREEVKIKEIKTKNNRHLAINDAVIDAIDLYLSHNSVQLTDFLFTSQSNNKNHYSNQHLDPNSIYRILRKADKETNLNLGISTHTLRRTFGYFFYINNGQSYDSLSLLQITFGHSDPRITLRYIGITKEDMMEGYHKLNLKEIN